MTYLGNYLKIRVEGKGDRNDTNHIISYYQGDSTLIHLNKRNILIDKMIVDYHCLMKESRSLLSRIYGIFKLELKDKGTINVMVQRNMNDLPFYSKLLTFDFKGSTVDRQIILKSDLGLIREKLWAKYKNKVLAAGCVVRIIAGSWSRVIGILHICVIALKREAAKSLPLFSVQ